MATCSCKNQVYKNKVFVKIKLSYPHVVHAAELFAAHFALELFLGVHAPLVAVQRVLVTGHVTAHVAGQRREVGLHVDAPDVLVEAVLVGEPRRTDRALDLFLDTGSQVVLDVFVQALLVAEDARADVANVTLPFAVHHRDVLREGTLRSEHARTLRTLERTVGDLDVGIQVASRDELLQTGVALERSGLHRSVNFF